MSPIVWRHWKAFHLRGQMSSSARQSLYLSLSLSLATKENSSRMFEVQRTFPSNEVTMNDIDVRQWE